MQYLSLCSGIEAATVAWHPLGWRATGYSEIDPFACAALAHHYPEVPNLGDMTQFQRWPDAAPNVLVGGTPCQSFSVAGLRAGLADPRGNLALTYLAIADRYRPDWLVWENVPGVLSSDRGRDFAAFLGGLGQLGYGWAYRVLDAQYFGLAQRRRRVLVVASARGWAAAAAVLFDASSLRGDPAPRRSSGEGSSGTLTRSALDGSSACGGDGRDGFFVAGVSPTLAAGGNSTGGARSPGTSADTAEGLIVQPYEVANCLTRRMHKGINTTADEGQTPILCHTLRADGFDASEDGTGRGIPILPVGFNARQDPDCWLDRTGPLDATLPNAQAVAFHENQRSEVTLSETAGSLKRGGGKPGQGYPAVLAQHFESRIARNGRGAPSDIASALKAQAGGSGKGDAAPLMFDAMQVRKLTPRECERLQGFPDDYTMFTYRGRPSADGPRYKALGNSMAVPVMLWLGQRIEAVDALLKATA